jgi:hypothetical protein
MNEDVYRWLMVLFGGSLVTMAGFCTYWTYSNKTCIKDICTISKGMAKLYTKQQETPS